MVTRRGAHLPWAPVDVTRREPEHWEVRTHFSQPQVVVLSQGLYPGWGARIDGQPTPLNGAEMLFMAVTVPPGEHTVEFTFDNAGIWLGRQLSQIALGAWLVLMLWGAARRR